jgi:hypothetical protein
MFFEWQREYNRYAGETIANIISHPDTSALFVLLGPALQNPPGSSSPYTHNWVSFEVGVAAGCRKPIWVFEEFGSFVRYPVPLVTDYAQYTPGSVEHLQYYGTVFQDRIGSETFSIQPPRTFQCEYTNCNARYRHWSVSKSFNCPVCRQPIPKGRTTGFTKPPGFPSNVV